MNLSERPIKNALHCALDVYLFAMRTFLVHNLREVNGKNLGETVRNSLNGSHLSSFELSLSKGKSIEDSIDIGHFGSLIYRNWYEVFLSTFHGYESVKNLVASIKKVRNRLAHPSQEEIIQDFDPGDAKKCLAEIADMLGRIDRPNEKRSVESISEQLFTPPAASDVAAPVAPKKDTPEAPPPNPAESGPSYWVYEDAPTSRARIHKAACRLCNDGRGLHGSRLPDNRWIGPLESVEVALEVALDTERRDIAECKFCRPLQ